MINIKNLTKIFNDKIIIDNLSLDIKKGSTTCIIGRSGEGKSVLLKQIIGLIKPTSGSIFIDDIDITQIEGEQLRETLSKCGYVFQFAALLDSLTVLENIGLPLLESGKTQEEILPLILEKLELLSLDPDVLNKYPGEISGGMKKRVGLARTLMTNPEIILYDEPTTGLDPVNSRAVYELIAEMQQKLNITSVIISHDVEIFKYVDSVALLNNGKIQYYGPAKNIWDSENEYVYQFIRGLSDTYPNKIIKEI